MGGWASVLMETFSVNIHRQERANLNWWFDLSLGLGEDFSFSLCEVFAFSHHILFGVEFGVTLEFGDCVNFIVCFRVGVMITRNVIRVHTVQLVLCDTMSRASFHSVCLPLDQIKAIAELDQLREPNNFTFA